MGAPETCHVIGGEHDGEDMDLLTALKEVVGYGIGTVLSCTVATGNLNGNVGWLHEEMMPHSLFARPTAVDALE